MRSRAQTDAAAAEKRRGHLKVYLGGTPGAGKTYAMLHEAHQLVAHGHDVVVGYVETYNRPRTVELLAGLEVVPRISIPYRGTTLEEMDLDAVIARRPEVALDRLDVEGPTQLPGVSAQALQAVTCRRRVRRW